MEIREIPQKNRILLVIIQKELSLMLIILGNSIRQVIIPVVATKLRNQAQTKVEHKIQIPIMFDKGTAVLSKTVQIQMLTQILRIHLQIHQTKFYGNEFK